MKHLLRPYLSRSFRRKTLFLAFLPPLAGDENWYWYWNPHTLVDDFRDLVFLTLPRLVGVILCKDIEFSKFIPPSIPPALRPPILRFKVEESFKTADVALCRGKWVGASKLRKSATWGIVLLNFRVLLCLWQCSVIPSKSLFVLQVRKRSIFCRSVFSYQPSLTTYKCLSTAICNSMSTCSHYTWAPASLACGLRTTPPGGMVRCSWEANGLGTRLYLEKEEFVTGGLAKHWDRESSHEWDGAGQDLCWSSLKKAQC